MSYGNDPGLGAEAPDEKNGEGREPVRLGDALGEFLAALSPVGEGMTRRPDVHGQQAAMDGHELGREIIRKHGTDRYPSPAANYRHLVDEIGELGQALIEWAGCGGDPALLDAVRKEYGDAGLTLHTLGDKLGLSLPECMAEVVRDETRQFAEPPGNERWDQLQVPSLADNGDRFAWVSPGHVTGPGAVRDLPVLDAETAVASYAKLISHYRPRWPEDRTRAVRKRLLELAAQLPENEQEKLPAWMLQVVHSGLAEGS